VQIFKNFQFPSIFYSVRQTVFTYNYKFSPQQNGRTRPLKYLQFHYTNDDDDDDDNNNNITL